MIQSLEGSRPIWTLNKRYTDFVKLHEKLTPILKAEMSRDSQLCPTLPSKISGQTDMELNQRQMELEDYMNQVLNVLSGTSQFNYDLLYFLEFKPTVLSKSVETEDNHVS